MKLEYKICYRSRCQNNEGQKKSRKKKQKTKFIAL